MIPDPIIVAGMGLLFGLTAGAAFLLGDLHGEVRVLRRVLSGRTSEERRRPR